MSNKTAEKICPHEPDGKYRRHLKRKVTKRRRADEKAVLEDAPKKPRFKGYST